MAYQSRENLLTCNTSDALRANFFPSGHYFGMRAAIERLSRQLSLIHI